MGTNMDNQNLYCALLDAYKRFPTLTAVVHGEREYSYADVHSRARTIAHMLNQCGTQPAALIPIATNGGVGMISAMIGCLQIGAAFVIVDASGPKARIDQMLAEIDSDVIIKDYEISQIECSAENIIDANKTDFPNFVQYAERTAQNLAYGLFTSGSTGKPKCCLNTHLGLINRFRFNSSVKPLGPGDTILQNSKHTFDPVLWQTLWPLTKGARVVIPERHGLLDIESTIASIERHKVVMTDIVPSVLAVMLKYLAAFPDNAKKLKSVEHIFVGGEEVSAKIVNDCHKLLPWVQLTNTYGPTEAAIGMIHYPLSCLQDEPVPLGYAIPGTFFKIVDPQMKLVPDGNVGQIVIGGNCLGQGYLNDPDKTAAVFKTAKLDGKNKEKIYLTGDLGCIRGGKLFFHGRVDNLVKINGVRVELKEVEINIEAIFGVEKSCALTVKDRFGKNCLIACITLNKCIGSEKIRKLLGDQLPPEFIPKEFIIIDDFPVTSVGKIDRKELQTFATKFINSSTDVEKTQTSLQALTAKYANNSNLRQWDNIFDLGIDSLSAVLLSLDICKKFNVTLSAADIFENPTLIDLEHKIATKNGLHGVDQRRPNISKKIAFWNARELVAPNTRAKILLTGATGYVGIHLLRVLTMRADSDIVCIVRAENDADALKRVQLAAKAQRISDTIHWNSIEAIAGDLSKSDIGISGKKWIDLIPSLSEIFHLGADVNFYKTFDDLEDVNVKSTALLAEHALNNPNLHFHYISTTSVLSQMKMSKSSINEICPSKITDFPRDGYGQTKLAGELVVKNLAEHNVPASIYRLGEVMPSPAYPVLNPKAEISSLLETFIDLGCVFDAPHDIHYTPIDDLVRSLAATKLDRNGSKPNLQVFDLANPNSINFLLIKDALNKSDFGIDLVNRDEFVGRLMEKKNTLGWSKNHMVTYEYTKQINLATECNNNKIKNRTSTSNKWSAVDVDYLACVFRSMSKNKEKIDYLS